MTGSRPHIMAFHFFKRLYNIKVQTANRNCILAIFAYLLLLIGEELYLFSYQCY